jgi:hypothetical protein
VNPAIFVTQRSGRAAGPPAPRVVLTITTPPYENMPVATTIGTLAVADHPSGSSGWTFAETADPDGKFAISGVNLNLAAALDYETKTSHSYTVTATKSLQANVVTTLTIDVLNTFEVTLAALSLGTTSFVLGTPSSGAISGASAGSTIIGIGLPSGLTTSGATWAWSGSGSTATGTFALREDHPDGNNSPRTTSGLAYTIAAASSIVGFALNGSTNTALKAMLARVAGGTGRGKILMPGDSTGVGAGSPIVSGTAANVIEELTGARAWRPSAALATELTGIGYPASDNAFVGDGSCGVYGVTLQQYDVRVTGASDAIISPDQTFAGGGFMLLHADLLHFVPTTNVDTFDVICYNAGRGIAFAMDGAVASGITAPGATVAGNIVTLPATNSGFTRITIPAGALGSHNLAMVKAGGVDPPLLASVRGYTSSVSGIEIITTASNGANSANQASANVGGFTWSALDYLGFQTPDLTIINLGLNDGAGTTLAANLQTIITKAKLTGDVLLVSPNPQNPTNNSVANQLFMRDAAAALAVTNSIAYIDLYTYFTDWPTFAPRSANGLNHPNRGAYAEIAQVYRRCIQAMVA